MASQLEIQHDSAMPDQIKRATLVQGGITRLLNTSIELGKEAQKEVLNKYMKKLQTSGYDLMYRLTILKSILNGWKKILEKSESGERPLHRAREFEQERRLNEKTEKKSNWYKGKNNQFESVMMVPATPMGELKQIIEEKAKKSNLKVKIVEKAGMKLSAYLKKYDKSSNSQPCEEKDCMICANTTKMKRTCRIPNIVYKITCKECEKFGKKAHYYGESSFNGYTRGVQHAEKYRSQNKKTQEKSALRMHAREHHNDKKIDYKMEVIKSFKKPIARQVFESIQIIKSKTEDHFPMNTKNDFNQALIVTAKYTKGCY